jgi:division protein CdvB (Snf7/Vps24/ESCRT-III family)
METSSKMNRTKAIRARESGDLAGSKMLIKASIQSKKQANITDNFRIKIEGVQYKLEQAKAMQDFTGVAKEISGALIGLQKSINIPALNEMIKQMDSGFENFDTLLDTTTEQLETMDAGSSSAVGEEEVEEALAEIDAEIGRKTSEALPSAPISSSEIKEDIGSLEDEIKRLKEQRNT